MSEAQKPERVKIITEGSCDHLAAQVIDVLKHRGMKITTFEGRATSGTVISALTRPGSVSVLSRGVIYSDKECLPGMFTTPIDLNARLKADLSQDTNYDELNALTNLLYSSRSEQFGLIVTSAETPQIGLSYKPNSSSNLAPTYINLTQSIERVNPFLKKYEKKQWYTHQALTAVLKSIGATPTITDFQPRSVSPKFEQWKNTVIEKACTLLAEKGYRIAFGESATGGSFSSVLSGASLFEEIFHSGLVLYNTEEKIMAGVSPYAVNRNALYGRSTAYELARQAVEKFPGVCAIGITGLTDTPDTRYPDKKPGTFYYSIWLPHFEPYTNKLVLPILARQEMKEAAAVSVFNTLTQLLS